jgi:nucleoside phosphorylase
MQGLLFAAEPHQIQADEKTISTITIHMEEIQCNVQEKCLENFPEYNDTKPMIVLGAMESGAAVIADPAIFNQVIRPQYRKCIAIDMETYGVYQSARYASTRHMNYLSIKSVSDTPINQSQIRYINMPAMQVLSVYINLIMKRII